MPDKELTEAVRAVAKALVLLGNAGAISPQGTELGAIENLSIAVKEGSSAIADAIHDLAEAIREKG